MLHIAVLGYGVVGSGVVRVLSENRRQIEKKAEQPVNVRRVLDIRDFPGDETVAPLLTHQYADILNDPEIRIVAEAMGGVEPAYTYLKQALLSGRHVCTSNKELVSLHGAELLAAARENAVSFLFEASVGGGIPVVRPMNLALTTDEVVAVAGILNGTTNYVLSQMAASGTDFHETLREAQALGYAEKNPADDVEGHDACRKLAILLSLAAGRHVDYRTVHTEGIARLTRADFDFARAFGYNIKLLADGRIRGAEVEALTAPMLVHERHPFAAVPDVFNGILVQARMTDSVMFFGRGAGKLPTAGAVVSDIVDIAKNLDRHIPHPWSREAMPVADPAGYVRKNMVRVTCGKGNGSSAPHRRKKAMEAVCRASGGAEAAFRELPAYPGQLAWITPPENEAETALTLAELAVSEDIQTVSPALRIYEPVIFS